MDDRRPDPELLASLALDDEIDRDELLALLDAMADDPTARDFWRRARRVEGQIDRLRDEMTPRRESWWRQRAIAVTAAAAVVLVALGLGLGLPRAPHDGQPTGTLGTAARTTDTTTAATAATDPVQLRLGEAPDSMDDTRFVQLAVELLRADHRYHDEMAQLLDDVRARGFVPESAAHGRRSVRETRIARSETNEDLHSSTVTESSVPAAF